MFEVVFPEPVSRDAVSVFMSKTSVAVSVRGIRGMKQPSIASESVKLAGKSGCIHVWWFRGASSKWMDIFAGVLLGEGYVPRISKIKNAYGGTLIDVIESGWSHSLEVDEVGRVRRNDGGNKTTAQMPLDGGV